MNTSGADGTGQIVSVTEEGRVTIPKNLRKKHGIATPGRVTFVENDAGEIVVRPVGSMREFRGLERSGEDERPATEVLREERERDRQRRDESIAEFTDRGSVDT